jgi:hypothetical protein
VLTPRHSTDNSFAQLFRSRAVRESILRFLMDLHAGESLSGETGFVVGGSGYYRVFG